jgi:hypothetical protein
MTGGDLLARFKWLYAADARDIGQLRTRWVEDAVILQDPTMPGTAGEFHGYAGIQALDQELRDAFDEVEWDPQEVRQLGDDRYLVLLVARGRGARSGVRFEEGVQIGHIVQLRGRRFARMETFVGWAPALHAAGVDRPTMTQA